MTTDAQSALRRVMELHTNITRFCIICNYVSRIMEPIASRCVKFRFKPLPVEPMVDRMKSIAETEGMQLSAATVNRLFEVSGGDLRMSITLMQSAHRLVSGMEEVTPETVNEVAGVVPDAVVTNLMAACKKGKFQAIQDAAFEAQCQGFPVAQILSQLQDVIVDAEDIKDISKANICIKLGESAQRLEDGADEHLQLLDILSVIAEQV